MTKFKETIYGNSKYILGDSIEYMKELINKGEKFDCIVTDPPYGINHKSNRRKNKEDMTTRSGILNDGHDNNDLLEEAINLSYDLLEDDAHIYWFTRWDRVDVQMPLLKKKFNIKNIIIWDKGNHGSGDLQGSYGNRYEVVIYGMKGRKIFNKVDDRIRQPDILDISNFTDEDILKFKDNPALEITINTLNEIYGLDPLVVEFLKVSHQKLQHPHQKPLDLLTFLIKKSTNVNDKVLDMFGGVGSTLISGELINRQVTAIELNDVVYNQGVEHIKNKISIYKK